MIDNIIFDWSGVIKDCVLSHLVITNKIFKQFGGKEISLDEFREEWRQPFMLFYKKYLPNITIEQEQLAYRKAILEGPKAEQYKNISNLIKKIKRAGKKVMVVSSDDPETILPEIKSFGLEGIFDEVVFGLQDKEEVCRKIMDKNNFDKEQTIFIGDSNHEIEVGKKIGIKTGAVTWGFNSEERLKSENPDFVFHDLEELEKVVL